MHWPAMDYSKIAELYDLYAQTDIDVPFFTQEAQGCQKVLELTSGTGRLSIPLLKAGVPLTCLDSSPEMLAILNQKRQNLELNMPIYEGDMTNFTLPGKYDLIIIPFNAFAEVIEPAAQQKALASMQAHLADNGRLIVTLHNPPIRLKQIDGQIHLRGKFALPNNDGSLFLSSVENYDPDTRLVKGAQFYELYNADGVMTSKRFVDMQFYLHTKVTFEGLAGSQGFTPRSLLGDYQRHEFDGERSPFMIWTLVKR
jgi:SAM-dependent methyltransferase